MKKRFFLMAALAVASLSVTSCDKIKNAAESVQQIQASSDLLNNAEELQKAEDALKELPQFKGKDLLVFQNVNFYGGVMPRIEIEILSPENGEDVDHYTYQNGSWSAPQPVQISGDGDMKENTTPLSEIKFANVATVFKNWKEKAATVEGVTQTEPDLIYFRLWVPDQTRMFDANTIEGSRAKYNINFNLDGSVKEFEKS